MFSKDIFTPLFETPAHKQLAVKTHYLQTS